MDINNYRYPCEALRYDEFDDCIARSSSTDHEGVEKCLEDASKAYEACKAAQDFVFDVIQRYRDRDIEEVKEYLEKLTQLPSDFLPPRPCGRRSEVVRDSIISDPKKAMIFSERIQEAFETTGIKLADDETYACLVCIKKKPKYLSEIVAIERKGDVGKSTISTDYIMEPSIMKRVAEEMQRDIIDYGSKNK